MTITTSAPFAPPSSPPSSSTSSNAPSTVVLSPLIRDWQAGWGLARSLSPAADVPGGLKATLGLPGRAHEYIALGDEPSVVTGLAREVATGAEPSWLTVMTGDLDRTVALMRAEGLAPFAETETFMTTGLGGHPRREAPEGYAVAVTVEDRGGAGGLVRAEVTRDGELAASGVMAVVGATGVAHTIATDPAHRRRGLGSVVMAALSGAAVGAGASVGVLIASADGERLYTSLGWDVLATVVSARLP
ncbi:hypothetical protein Afil01_50710 [Actinorhabdospora filicis]|uniref:N-acetyltransferase domain-containing protein n=1 Tax=Actinorhabdospora filicis TaxID=1785913 RepID=A0A9W6SNR5_9ACTN|nr:GNAT family N-acetyltransferase [Actinorhabdospora filicis]GLZ80264.1 hypothetical protein Afil01_50710 [Actinorhabdospora filicis]